MALVRRAPSAIWTHAMCDCCWQKREPFKKPERIKAGLMTERCCFCRAFTDAGIYLRVDDRDPGLRCGGGLHTGGTI